MIVLDGKPSTNAWPRMNEYPRRLRLFVPYSWTVCSWQAGKPVLRLFAICRLHSIIRAPFVDGLLLTGWKARATVQKARW